jgi:hypothetical protein
MILYRYIRLFNYLFSICGVIYVNKLFVDGIIIDDIRTLLWVLIATAMFIVDLVITFLSKEPFYYFYGANKKNTPHIYQISLSVDIFMILILSIYAINIYHNLKT